MNLNKLKHYLLEPLRSSNIFLFLVVLTCSTLFDILDFDDSLKAFFISPNSPRQSSIVKPKNSSLCRSILQDKLADPVSLLKQQCEFPGHIVHPRKQSFQILNICLFQKLWKNWCWPGRDPQYYCKVWSPRSGTVESLHQSIRPTRHWMCQYRPSLKCISYASGFTVCCAEYGWIIAHQLTSYTPDSFICIPAPLSFAKIPGKPSDYSAFNPGWVLLEHTPYTCFIS